MLTLFQSIFGREKARQRYPESLIEAAITRAVDGTDPRLKALPGYRKFLREPVIHAIDHVISLVDALPPPLVASRVSYGTEPRLSTLFSSAENMLEVFSRDATLADFTAATDGTAGQRVVALLLAERVEKHMLGIDLVGDTLRKDVAQIAVNFMGYRLVDPMLEEPETRRALKRRAFDHLLSLALARMVERREERADLVRQRDLLQRKLRALEQSGWDFNEVGENPQRQAPALLAELEAIEDEFAKLGADSDVLQAHLQIVADHLGTAEQQLWSESVDLRLDRMNIQRTAKDTSARNIVMQELHNAAGRRLIALLVSVAPDELPKRESLFATAGRYLI